MAIEMFWHISQTCQSFGMGGVKVLVNVVVWSGSCFMIDHAAEIERIIHG